MNKINEKILIDPNSEYTRGFYDGVNFGIDTERSGNESRIDNMAYGGYKCTCCGETEPKFLSIDHTGYQILCHNCNMALGSYGYCPHSSIKPTETNVKYSTKKMRRYRREVIEHYGAKCVCCGEE